LAKAVTNRLGVTNVFSRIVLALEERHPRGTTVVYTRKRANRPCRCSLTEWRRWTRRTVRVAKRRTEANVQRS